MEELNNLFSKLNFDISMVLDPSFYVEYTSAIAAFIITFTALRVAKSIIGYNLRKLADKTANKLDDAVVDVFDSLGLLFYLSISLYAAAQFLKLPPLGEDIIYYIALIALIYYMVKAAQRAIDFFTEELIKKRKEAEGKYEDVSLIQLANQLLKYSLWLVALLLFLSNLGIDIAPLLAGASIGGIAIAFALQNLLTDIFASFSIYFDKPFKVGDFVVLGNDMGTIKRIGIKTTRIQALQGEELVISNRELTSTRINNYKRMNKRRISFKVGVTYQTSAKKLEKIPNMVKKIIGKEKLAKFDRCHFKEFGDSALIYEIVYYVLSNDYNKYMDTQQNLNLEIAKAFQKEKIEFAYPTQTIFLEK